MAKKKVTLLERAIGDLNAAKILLPTAPADDVIMDITAHHCQQCVEKVAKYLILLQGDAYVNDHRSDVYLEDLKDVEAVGIIEGIATKIDAWATTIRYAASILSNEKAVLEVVASCEQLIALAKAKTPEKFDEPIGDVKKHQP